MSLPTGCRPPTTSRCPAPPRARRRGGRGQQHELAAEGLAIGVLGALAGGGLGLAAAATFVGQLSLRLVIAAAAAAVVGVALAGIAALVPAQLQRRVAMSALLAEQ